MAGKITQKGLMNIFEGKVHKTHNRELKLYSVAHSGISEIIINEDFPEFEKLWSGDWFENVRITVTIERLRPKRGRS